MYINWGDVGAGMAERLAWWPKSCWSRLQSPAPLGGQAGHLPLTATRQGTGSVTVELGKEPSPGGARVLSGKTSLNWGDVPCAKNIHPVGIKVSFFGKNVSGSATGIPLQTLFNYWLWIVGFAHLQINQYLSCGDSSTVSKRKNTKTRGFG